MLFFRTLIKPRKFSGFIDDRHIKSNKLLVQNEMTEKYYFDTSIWLDFFEDRNEPNLPKGEWAHRLFNKIIENNDQIIYSDNTLYELKMLGYSEYEFDALLLPFKTILIYVQSTEKQISRAKDLSLKRNLPKRDALHALIARDNKATLITLDKHFHRMGDIIKAQRPQDLI